MSEKSYLQYLEQPEFREILQKARQLRSKVFSDILDGEGNQYVDLVQEGGGVLGIALVGYTYVLEEAGIRFFHLAGTSAGAINTLVMAGIGTIDKRKSEEILQALAAQNLFDFVDGDPVLKKLLQRVIDGTPLKKIKWSLLWNLRKLKSAILDHLGLNPGNQFETWLETLLENSAAGIKTIGELLELRQKEHFPASLH
ncbi:MAG TPA: patatin-like phospholipase family protein, partial [Prolixibacteraceae bacterium]|nr:patatin-like phospholipase family protein [Prolixibacteraceae bacterium]